MKRTSIFFGAAAVTTLGLASGLAAPALADAERVPEISAGPSLASVPVAPTGLGLQLGGGVTGFSREATRDQFGTGGYWDARVVYGTRSYLGAELAYVGSVRDTRLSGGPQLVGNGAEGALRANLPLSLGTARLTPFAFGGVGWTYYSAMNDEIGSSNIKDGNALTIPFGAGLSATYRGFIIDARFTYRSVFDDDLVRKAGGNDHADLQNWSAGMTLGYEI